MLRIFPYCWLGIQTCFILGLEPQRLQVFPLDFQIEEGASYFTGIGQIESDGRHFYVLGAQETEILVMEATGRVVRRIGGKGNHPAEFGQVGVLSISVKSGELWGIDWELKRVRQFVEGAYRKSFPLDSFNISHGAAIANNFAFSDRFVVIPARTEKKHLAGVYSHDGALVKQIGVLLDFPEIHERILGMNDTHWLAWENKWVSVHKFFPLVTVYDADFKQIDQFQIESPIIRDMVDRTIAYDPGSQYTLAAPVFTDVKIFHNDLYAMCKGFLHRVGLQSHVLQSITTFYGKGDDFKDVSQDRLTLFYFAFSQDGHFVIGHPAMLWNHDLWTADFPLAAP